MTFYHCDVCNLRGNFQSTKLILENNVLFTLIYAINILVTQRGNTTKKITSVQGHQRTYSFYLFLQRTSYSSRSASCLNQINRNATICILGKRGIRERYISTTILNFFFFWFLVFYDMCCKGAERAISDKKSPKRRYIFKKLASISTCVCFLQ